MSAITDFYKWEHDILVPNNIATALYERMCELGYQKVADNLIGIYNCGYASDYQTYKAMAEYIEDIEQKLTTNNGERAAV